MGTNLDMQYIMDGNGNYYRVNGSDQLVVAGSRDEATIFTFTEANRRIGSGKKSRFYQTISAETSDGVRDNIVTYGGEKAEDNSIEKVAGISNNVQSALAQTMEYNIAEIDWNEYLNLFCYLANSSKNRQDELSKELAVVDRKICDLLHYIELYDLTPEESLEAMVQVKDARMARRDIKDEFEKIELFKTTMGTSANVSKVMGTIKELKKFDTRTYRPRELPELFDGMSDRKTDRNAKRTVAETESAESMEITEVELYQEEVTMEYCRQETVFDGRKNDWQSFAKQQLEFYANAQQYMMNLELDLDELDNAIEDVLRETEDANYNVTQGYKVFKELKDLRNERKEKLQEWEQLKIMTERFDCRAMAEVYGEVLESV